MKVFMKTVESEQNIHVVGALADPWGGLYELTTKKGGGPGYV